MFKGIVSRLGRALPAIAVCVPLAAQELSQHWTRCANQGRSFSVEEIISGCTAVLQADGESAASRAAAHYNRGIAYAGRKDYDGAIADYNEAIRLNPSYALAYFDRGNAYFAKRDYDLAIAGYSEAIRLDPSYPFAYFNRGTAYYNKRHYDLAIADYGDFIRLDPKQAIAYSKRGLAYAALGRRKEAIADFVRALSLDPNMEESRDALKRLLAGR
jgi:tetratricopeptide (TPR) repeat protein